MKYPIPESALTQHIAVLGKTGSGKTPEGEQLVEDLGRGQVRASENLF